MHRKVDNTVVDPMEVFMAMSASLMDKQPVPFNPVYAIKPSAVQKLKIGGKPPREVFYRDTLTFMTKLPPAVQPKICTCKYLCSGAPAAIICHSCSIYDPTRAAYYCDKCFLSRHPWHRVPHMYTTIENDESISHTLKIAHRVAEASRYENEGKGILHKLQKEKPKLRYVADDEKLDDQMRLYGRKVSALEEQVQQMRERLQNDIMHGDDMRRKSLYSREKIEDEPASEMETEPVLGIENGSIVNKSTVLATPAQRAPQKLVDLRDSPFFESEPLFSDLQEGEEGFLSLPSYAVSSAPPANQQSTQSLTHAALPSRKPMFLRADSTDSTGSMTLSPMDEQVGFFRGESGIGMGLMRSSLNMIDEGGSESEKNSLSFPGITELNDGNELNEESDSLGSLKQHNSRTADSQKMKTVLSGISFTSVAHSDLDSVHSAHSNNSGTSTVGYDQDHGNSNVSSLSSSSVCIQRVFKGYLTRRTVSKMLTTRLVKVFSLEAGRDYYYDTKTGASMWVPPKLLHADHLEELRYVAETAQVKLWACKRSCPRRREEPVTSKDVAAAVLNRFGRCILSRYRIQQRADTVYRRIHDAETDAYYYANVFTGETSWYKCKVYLAASREPPIHTEASTASNSGKAEGVSGKDKNMRRSPRTKRVV